MSVPTLQKRPLKKNFVDSRTVNGQMLDTLGTHCDHLHLHHVIRESIQCVLLGLDFLTMNHALLDLGRGLLQLWDVSVSLLWTEFHRLAVSEGLLCRMALPEPMGEK